MSAAEGPAAAGANVAAAILGVLASDALRPFLCCEQEPLSRGAALEQVARRRAQLLGAGIGRGSRVLVAGGRGNRFWIDLIALWCCGAVPVPLEPGVGAEHAAAIRAKARPQALLRGDAVPGAGLDEIEIVPELDGEGPSSPASAAAVAPGELALILFTSGTTGLPKGVMLSHRAVLANARGTLQVLDVRADDRLFMAIPFRFVSALSHFLTAALRGAALHATERRLLQSDLCAALAASGASAFGGGPVQIRWLAEHAATQPLALRWLMSSGDHLSPEVADAIRARVPGARLFVAYGLTEVGGRFCMLPPERLDEARGSVGRPIPGMCVAVLGEGGAPVAPGEIGEVHARGGCLFDGYAADPEVTAACLSERGFATGDLGYLDEAGWLHLCGRSDDVFKSGGVKVSTLPIADALLALGCFRDVAVIAAEDPILGHVPVVYYVLVRDAVFERPRAVRALREKLPPSHVPRRFAPLPAIPRTASGKIDRRALQALIARAS